MDMSKEMNKQKGKSAEIDRVEVTHFTEGLNFGGIPKRGKPRKSRKSFRGGDAPMATINIKALESIEMHGLQNIPNPNLRRKGTPKFKDKLLRKQMTGESERKLLQSGHTTPSDRMNRSASQLMTTARAENELDIVYVEDVEAEVPSDRN